MPSNCCVPQCTAYYKKNKDLKYHQFPTSKHMRQKWIHAIKSNKNPSKHSKVCSKHFVDSDYNITSMGQWKILKREAVPSHNLPVRSLEDAHKETIVSARTRRYLKNYTKNSLVNQVSNVERTAEMTPEPNDECDRVTSEVAMNVVLSTGHTNLNEESSEAKPEKLFSVSKNVQTTLSFQRSQLISVSFLSEAQLKHFTGFYRNEFNLICSTFSINSHFNTALSVEDEILLTLMKYRHAFYYRTLQNFFDIDSRVVQRIFEFWTKKIYSMLKTIDFWALKRKRSELEYDVVVDCTEFSIEKSSDPIIQQTTFSSYKNTNTFKVLVGCTEYGAVVYVSDVYGGSISDRNIIEKSGFLDILESGQFVLADRGFDISDLLEQKQVRLNIPPFKTQKQLSEHDISKTRSIANRRIIIEQINGLAKKNLILVKRMNKSIWPLANEIVYNCFMLTSFRDRIVKE